VISKGVQPGETVVTSGQLQLAPGAKVSVQPATKSSPNETGGNGQAP
jgi:hypothetical protein